MAGTIARRHRRAPAKRIGRGSEAQKPDRIEVRVGRLSDLLYPLRPPITPTKMAGARTRIDQQASGPGRAEMLAKTNDARIAETTLVIRHLAAGFTPRVHPHREQSCEGRNPMSAAGRQEGRTQPSGQAAEDRETRVRNVACEKRPRRMTRFDPGRREPAPTDVVGQLMSASIQQG